MTFRRFRLLSPEGQLDYVLDQGTYLGQRWEGEWDVLLYYLGDGGRGFFAEVGLAPVQAHFVVQRSFTHGALLEKASSTRPE